MHLSHPAWLDREESRRHRLRNAEIRAVGDLYRPALGGSVRLHASEIEHEGKGGLAGDGRDRVLHIGERRRLLALEDPAVLQRNVLKRLGGHAEIPGQHLGWGMHQPVRH